MEWYDLGVIYITVLRLELFFFVDFSRSCLHLLLDLEYLCLLHSFLLCLRVLWQRLFEYICFSLELSEFFSFNL